MAGFLFKLETAVGAPADPPQFRTTARPTQLVHAGRASWSSRTWPDGPLGGFFSGPLVEEPSSPGAA
jgi:hypothetical protein